MQTVKVPNADITNEGSRSTRETDKNKQLVIFSIIVTETKINSQYTMIENTLQQLQQLGNILCIEKHKTQLSFKIMKARLLKLYYVRWSRQKSLPLVLLKNLDLLFNEIFLSVH